MEDEIDRILDVAESESIFYGLKNNDIGFVSMDSTHHTQQPIGRGLYANKNRTQFILINEQDHLRIISTRRSGHFGELTQQD